MFDGRLGWSGWLRSAGALVVVGLRMVLGQDLMVGQGRVLYLWRKEMCQVERSLP